MQQPFMRHQSQSQAWELLALPSMHVEPYHSSLYCICKQILIPLCDSVILYCLASDVARSQDVRTCWFLSTCPTVRGQMLCLCFCFDVPSAVTLTGSSYGTWGSADRLDCIDCADNATNEHLAARVVQRTSRGHEEENSPRSWHRCLRCHL